LGRQETDAGVDFTIDFRRVFEDQLGVAHIGPVCQRIGIDRRERGDVTALDWNRLDVPGAVRVRAVQSGAERPRIADQQPVARWHERDAALVRLLPNHDLRIARGRER